MLSCLVGQDGQVYEEKAPDGIKFFAFGFDLDTRQTIMLRAGIDPANNAAHFLPDTQHFEAARRYFVQRAGIPEKL